MTVAVRRAAAGDASALATLRWEWRTERGERGMSASVFAARLAAWIADHGDTHTAWLAEVSGVPVGMAWLAVVDRIPGPGVWDRRSGHVQSVYVQSAHRGAGIGAALVDAVVAHARTLRLAYLMVHPSPPSFTLYRRAGFVDTGGVLELGL